MIRFRHKENTLRKNQANRIELTDVTSNLLVVSSVVVALMPLLLGDRLVLVAGSTVRQLSILLNELSTFVMKALY